MEGVHNALKQFRARAELTQHQLARRAGLSRQALNALETGRSEPSTAAALRLAAALQCRVEDLFWLEDAPELVRAKLAAPGRRGSRVALADVAGSWIAHPLATGNLASLQLPADGVLRERVGSTEAKVRALRPLAAMRANLLAVGCDPALGLLSARLAERSVRLVWLDAASEPALQALSRGHAHLAGAHLLDEASGEFNVPFVRALFPGRRMLVVTLAAWEEGFAVARGNPLRIRHAADLARPAVRLVNRAFGAGARRLLDRLLVRAGVPATAIQGYERTVRGHLDVAHAVASGTADVGIVPRAVARAQGLDFVPLSRERFDLVLPFELAEDHRVARTLDTLGSRSFRRELAALGGYDAARSGRVVAEVGGGQ
jgi:molybdopterin molybdotransferase/putative molybdopterin biosynthesis protein